MGGRERRRRSKAWDVLNVFKRLNLKPGAKLSYDALIEVRLGGNVVAMGMEDLHNLGLVVRGETDAELTKARWPEIHPHDLKTLKKKPQP